MGDNQGDHRLMQSNIWPWWEGPWWKPMVPKLSPYILIFITIYIDGSWRSIKKMAMAFWAKIYVLPTAASTPTSAAMAFCCSDPVPGRILQRRAFAFLQIGIWISSFVINGCICICSELENNDNDGAYRGIMFFLLNHHYHHQNQSITAHGAWVIDGNLKLICIHTYSRFKSQGFKGPSHAAEGRDS